jgi:hypothetical protein
MPEIEDLKDKLAVTELALVQTTVERDTLIITLAKERSYLERLLAATERQVDNQRKQLQMLLKLCEKMQVEQSQ